MDVIDKIEELREKKRKGGNKKKKSNKIKRSKYKTRRAEIADGILDCVKELWFNNDKDKINEFVDWLIIEDDKDSEYSLSELDSEKNLNAKLDELFSKSCGSPKDVIKLVRKQTKLIKKYNTKNKFRVKNKDMGIAKLLNPDTYSKKYLNNSDYRKELKRLAKREKDEIDELSKLGYIDCSIKSYSKRSGKKLDKLMKNALSDGYAQKHLL